MLLNLYKQYLEEQCDESGRPTAYRICTPKQFNFAYDVVDRLGTETPDRRAMLWCSHDDVRRTFTFRDIKEQSDRAAAYFLSLGIRRGDPVMLILKRHYQFWFAMMGLCKIGAVAVPATNQLRKEDLLYRFQAAGIRAVICTLQPHEAVPDMVEAAAAEYGGIEHRIGVNGTRSGWLDFDRGLETAPPFTPPEPADRPAISDIMLMYFTSGTTAHPKMVVHDYAYPLAHIITARYWHRVVPDGLHLTVAETGWAKSIWGKLYGQWLMEAGIYVYDFERFDPGTLLSHLQDDAVTTFCAPPTVYRFLMKENLSGYDLSAIRHATIAGEALNPAVFAAFEQSTGLKLCEGFGQTETTLTIFTDAWTEPRPGSMGRPSKAYNICLINEAGQPAADHETGEICIDTRQGTPTGMFLGYHRDPEMTRSVWHDGYYHTGDLAFRDEDGYYWFIGRKDDVIKSSGYRISAFEVENTLMECPAVLECAVTGVADEIRGQKVKATIVPAKGYSPTENLKKIIQSFVKERTAPYKYPRLIEFVTELPKTISGKIRRVELRAADHRKRQAEAAEKAEAAKKTGTEAAGAPADGRSAGTGHHPGRSTACV